MIAETISLGILGLPHALSTLGFLPGVLLLLFIGASASYTGYITYQFKTRYPQVRSYADAGEIVAGAFGRWVAEVMSLVFLIFIMAAHICTFTVAMNVLTGHATCSVVFGAAAMVVSILLTTPRTLKGQTWISGICKFLLKGLVLGLEQALLGTGA
jgi:amino acid permease